MKNKPQAKAKLKDVISKARSAKFKAGEESEEKDSMQNKAEKAGEFAKNIWLAGLGAYGRAFEAASDASKTSKGGSDSFFEGLVERGQKLEQKARDQIKPMQKPDMSKQKLAIEERIEKMRNYLGMNAGKSDTASDTEKDAEIERLKKQVSSLEAKLKSSPAKRKAAVKSKSKAKAKTIAKATSKRKAKTVSKSKVKSTVKAKAKTKTKVKAKAKPKTKAKTAATKKTAAKK